METVHAVYFFGFRKPRWQIQTTKGKRSNTLIFAKKLPKKLIFYRAYNKNEEHKYSRSEFYYPKDLMQRLTPAYSGIVERQDDFIRKQKSANTNKMATDLNTLLRSL